MSIFDVQHQPRAHRILQRAMACERMPHAYLFAGQEGIGKEMLANRLAQTLVCSEAVRVAPPDDIGLKTAIEACGQCPDCTSAVAGNHPDITLIHRQLNRLHPDSRIRKQMALTLSVDVIRHFLVDRAGTRPSRGRARVFIVRESEKLSDAAQNALLKTLEEPPRHTIIILLTAALDRMLPTTRSRCQQVVFQTLPTTFIESQVKAMRPDAKASAVRFVAGHSDGSLGRALQLLDDGIFDFKQNWGKQLVAITSGDRRVAPHELAKPMQGDAQELAKLVADRDPDVSDTDATRQGLRELISVLADYYLDALRTVTCSGLGMINSDQAEVIRALADRHDAVRLQKSLKHLADAETHLARNANIDLTLETLFIRLAGGGIVTAV